jgi:hypothetical protein
VPEDDPDYSGATVLTGSPRPIEARLAAWWLCRNVEHIETPSPADVARWAAQIRRWATNHPDRVRRYGTPGARRYVLPELLPLADNWRPRRGGRTAA